MGIFKFKEKFNFSVYAQTARTIVLHEDAARPICEFIKEGTYPNPTDCRYDMHEVYVRPTQLEKGFCMFTFSPNIKVEIEGDKLISLELM